MNTLHSVLNHRTVRLQIYSDTFVGFWAKEENYYIRAIRSGTKAILCPGTILLESNTLVPIVLIQLGNETIYMAYFDYYSALDRKCLASLIIQKEFYLIFYNESQTQPKRIAVQNALSHFFKSSHDFIEKNPSLKVSSIHEKMLDFRAIELWKNFSQTVR